MSNGARHGLGVVIGLIVTPIIAACMAYGTTKLGQFARILAYEGSDRWVGGGLVLVAAVLIGLVAGSRVSPLASLIPGVVFTIVGLLWVFSPRWAFRHAGRDIIPDRIGDGYLTLSAFGIFLLLGVGLLVASVAPSRWRARTGLAHGPGPRFGGPPPAPMGPPPMHQQPMHQPMHSPMQAPMQQAPMHGAPPQPGVPQPPAPGSPGASTPPWQGVPQYGQPPAQPSAPNPPPLPSASPPSPPPADDKPPSGGPSASDDDEPGEWTRMYGGNR
ncbi:hypothetical protein [Actinomadura decatromicini]|uniref:Uncharacterized protein n=1 Tax=Actinomadura decatromicini TaxID=2604572 RepID=A0A5D3FZB3_9ACTN|nr:hypothetical protein [Actinomadura decatromicini]TYK53523.1 hypothetical protein FXF68_07530 [Actinomadura decatromicini]